MKPYYAAFFFLILLLVFSCNKDDDPELPPVPVVPVDPPDTTDVDNSPVNFDLDEVPYNTLSEYSFFEGELSDLLPVEGVLPYKLITPLFTDYAKKSRFVWMPEGVTSSYDGDTKILNFEDGAVLIKNFYYENVQPSNTKRIIETRIMFKREGEWVFANYVWNADQSEAILDLNGSFTSVEWLNENGDLQSVNYRIPSDAECLVCHKSSDMPIPIGPKPQNINTLHTYAEGVKNQLEKWEEMGYLNSGYPSQIETIVSWDDPTQDLSERVRSYIDVNCSHCHQENSHCDYRPMRFAFSETIEAINMGICVEPDEDIPGADLTHIILPGSPERSVLYYRISSTEEAVRMPLTGRTVVHQEAVDLIFEYINSLDPC